MNHITGPTTDASRIFASKMIKDFFKSSTRSSSDAFYSKEEISNRTVISLFFNSFSKQFRRFSLLQNKKRYVKTTSIRKLTNHHVHQKHQRNCSQEARKGWVEQYEHPNDSNSINKWLLPWSFSILALTLLLLSFHCIRMNQLSWLHQVVS